MTLVEMIAAFRKAGSPASSDRGSTQKGERVPISKVDCETWAGYLVSPAGQGVPQEAERTMLHKAGKRPVSLPDTYGGVAMVDSAAKHGYIAHADSPGECAICGGGLGDDRHWQDAGA